MGSKVRKPERGMEIASIYAKEMDMISITCEFLNSFSISHSDTKTN